MIVTRQYRACSVPLTIAAPALLVGQLIGRPQQLQQLQQQQLCGRRPTQQRLHAHTRTYVRTTKASSSHCRDTYEILGIDIELAAAAAVDNYSFESEIIIS